MTVNRSLRLENVEIPHPAGKISLVAHWDHRGIVSLELPPYCGRCVRPSVPPAACTLTNALSQLHRSPAVHGTPFQESVWRCIASIPLGEVRTYSQIATLIGAPRAVRAVANACGANRWALLIPCHRVIGANGSLGGFKWGLEWKRALLRAEAETALLPGEVSTVITTV